MPNQDRLAFLLESAEALRTGEWNRLRADQLAEELEIMAGGEKSAVRSLAMQILRNFLKLHIANPAKLERNRRHWQVEILEFQAQLDDQLEDSRTLEQWAEDPKLLEKAYQKARRLIEQEFEEIKIREIPGMCPWTWPQVRGLEPVQFEALGNGR